MKRDEMIEDLKTLKAFFEEQSGAYPVSLEFAIKELSEPKRRGKWIYYSEWEMCECDQCGEMIEAELASRADYCPHCGSYNKEET